MEVVLVGFLWFKQRRLNRSTECSGWLTVRLLVAHETTLEAEEFHNNLRLCYGITPSNLPPYCNGCGTLLLPCCVSWGSRSLPVTTPSSMSGRPSVATPLAA